MTGYLRLHVYTADGLFPIKNARVEISRYEDGKKKTVKNILTDENGNTSDIPLTADENFCGAVIENDGMSCSVYDIKAEADGYMPYTEKNIKIFEGMISYRSIELILSGMVV